MITLLLWAVIARAAPVNLTCTTDPLTTSLAVFTVHDEVTFRVIHHNGTDFLPLAANVTPHDLPALAAKAKLLEALGAQYELHLNNSQCSFTRGKLVTCHGVVDQVIQGHHVSYFSFDTSETSTLSPLFPDPSRRTVADLALTLDGRDVEFSVSFGAGRCVDTSR